MYINKPHLFSLTHHDGFHKDSSIHNLWCISTAEVMLCQVQCSMIMSKENHEEAFHFFVVSVLSPGQNKKNYWYVQDSCPGWDSNLKVHNFEENVQKFNCASQDVTLNGHYSSDEVGLVEVMTDLEYSNDNNKKLSLAGKVRDNSHGPTKHYDFELLGLHPATR